MSTRRITLTDEDVEALRRVAPFADRNAYRPLLTLVHVWDGLAYATDSYRLAFTEIDCDDLRIPAECVKWLPPDGCTLTVTTTKAVEPVGERTVVSWDEDGDTVGGSFVIPPFGGALTADDLLRIVTKAAPNGRPIFAARRSRLTAEPQYTHHDGQAKPMALVADRALGVWTWIDHKFLTDAVKALDETFGVAFGANPAQPAWLFDDDLTIVQMPIRPFADLTVETWVA